jgi:ferrous iron transport protein A
MDQRVSNLLSLADLPVGASATITQIAGGGELRRRLSGLGLRVGTRIRIEHRRGSGLVVASGSVRVALGGGIVDKLVVTPADPDEAGSKGPEPH